MVGQSRRGQLRLVLQIFEDSSRQGGPIWSSLVPRRGDTRELTRYVVASSEDTTEGVHRPGVRLNPARMRELGFSPEMVDLILKG